MAIVRRRVKRDGRGGTRTFCPACGEAAEMISAGEAAAVRGSTERAIFSLAADGTLHTADGTDGTLLVCLNSLLGAPKT